LRGLALSTFIKVDRPPGSETKQLSAT
jgi:hypothetical protein